MHFRARAKKASFRLPSTVYRAFLLRAGVSVLCDQRSISCCLVKYERFVRQAEHVVSANWKHLSALYPSVAIAHPLKSTRAALYVCVAIGKPAQEHPLSTVSKRAPAQQCMYVWQSVSTPKPLSTVSKWQSGSAPAQERPLATVFMCGNW